MAAARREVNLTRSRGLFRARFLAMGSPCELLVETVSETDARHLADIAATEAWRIEDKFSRYLSGNIVDQINRGAEVVVDDETANLLDFSATLFDMSDGRFDITSGVLREAWTFDGSDNLPAAGDVERILERIGWDKVSWDRPRIALRNGMQIDFGGVAKEYAADKAAAMLSTETGDACLVNFGGDLFATKALSNGDAWQVGIDTYDEPGNRAQKLIRLENGGLATSGDARRFLMKDGVRYGHILDPTTGWPVTGAPRSITVAADTCTQAGMLSTLAMLQGREAESFLEEEGVRFWSLR